MGSGKITRKTVWEITKEALLSKFPCCPDQQQWAMLHSTLLHPLGTLLQICHHKQYVLSMTQNFCTMSLCVKWAEHQTQAWTVKYFSHWFIVLLSSEFTQEKVFLWLLHCCLLIIGTYFICLSSNNFIGLLASSRKNTNNTEKGSRLDTKHAECFQKGPCEE